ncbi:MAG: hypothetical protein MUC36_12830 [Planctomycetes bacterium]|jgi:hypothetical protein|nr:hypothetical protein [Planctomycetota bacterium]
MTVRKLNDQGFDDFRRERKRVQAKLGPQASALGYENQALRELEVVEANEMRDRQLTREVHEFFASATKQAAAIVDRVAKDAQQEAGARIEQQMEQFLIDALGRMNTFVMAVLQQRRGPVAETQMEPKIGNLAPPALDEFRSAGTAETGDKHFGQDPFATPVEDVQREFRSARSDTDSGDLAVPIDQHLVASLEGGGPKPTALDEAESDEPDITIRMPDPPAPRSRTTAAPMVAPRPVAEKPLAVPPAVSAPAPVAAPTAAPSKPAARSAAPAALAPAPATTTPQDELERFKGALKALVRQGVMSREEARAAWDARLQSLGLRG